MFFPFMLNFLWAVVYLKPKLYVLIDQIILTPLGDVANQLLLTFWGDILFLTHPFQNSTIPQLST